MTIQHRVALALSASIFACGLTLAPAAYAADDAAMSKSAMHKHMKKHKGSMKKGDAMKGDAMKGDAMEKTDEAPK